MVAQVGSAALHASTTFKLAPLNWILGGVTQYYVTETSVNPAQSYTIESGVSDYTTEDGLQSYTLEAVRQRYITEAGVNAVGPFYVASIGGPPAVVCAASTSLTARPGQTQSATAGLAAGTFLTAIAGVRLADSAALTAATVLAATANLGASGKATLSAATVLRATPGVASLIPPLVALTRLSAVPTVRTTGVAAFAASTSLTATLSFFANAALAATTSLFGDGQVASAPQVSAQSLLEATTTLFGYATRVPYPPSLVGHALIYIVTAPIAAQLTSDPVIGPLIGNSGVTVWHTQTNSVTQLSGSWFVIFKKNQPFDLELAESQKCVLIYDQTALVQRKSSLFVVLKNDITPPLQDLEIVVDGFGSLIMPSTLPSLIGV
jgi:hypothetical protein